MKLSSVGLCLAGLFLAAGAAGPALASDSDNIRTMREMISGPGDIKKQQVHAYTREIDLHTRSYNRDDAQAIANQYCILANRMSWDYSWKVKVYVNMREDKPLGFCEVNER